MVVQRIWNFAKRHRKKLLAGIVGVSGAGLYYFLRVRLPKLQQDMLENLLKELSEGATASSGQDEQQQRRVRFQKHQVVSDSYARRGLPAFLARHGSCFNTQACHAKVKEAKDKDTKLQAFKELQAECLALVASSAYALQVILLLHRVQFNIAGREVAVRHHDEMMDANEEGSAVMQLIDSTEFFLEQGPALVSAAARRAVKEALATANLLPDTAVTAATLSAFFKEVFEKMEPELWADSKGSSLLPPDNARLEKVKPFLDEARDYLESPQLLQVVRAVTAAAAERLPEELAATRGQAAGLKAGSVKLALLFGGCMALGRELLEVEPEASENAEAAMRAFADKTVVDQFCEAIYFQEPQK
ncbi:unnamed protein product [Effrenium voratum]|uniref:Peroxin-3 n=1 Tax=Effrenium voratum TaxID=2562239 RepID=A0AA36I482_9DINO|nr:unnamed protein product [Effrenium voratum]CAJ1419921.1 unnamed protein product [Effrenium voratum]